MAFKPKKSIKPGKVKKNSMPPPDMGGGGLGSIMGGMQQPMAPTPMAPKSKKKLGKIKKGKK